MATITMNGREIPLLYTSYEMKVIQEEVAPLGKIMDLIMGKNPDDEKDISRFLSPEHLKTLGEMIRILGNAGLEYNGEKPDLTEKKVLRALRPIDVDKAIIACLEALDEGMASEIPAEETTGPVDVVLEEIKKKEPKEN